MNNSNFNCCFPKKYLLSISIGFIVLSVSLFSPLSAQAEDYIVTKDFEPMQFGGYNLFFFYPSLIDTKESDPTTSTLLATSSSLASNITQNSAILSSTIISGDSITIRGFEYGLNYYFGSTTSITGTNLTGTFQKKIEGLLCNKTYYFRSFAGNSKGYGYGDIQSFPTKVCQITGTATTTGTALTNTTTTSNQNTAPTPTKILASPKAVSTSPKVSPAIAPKVSPAFTPMTSYVPKVTVSPSVMPSPTPVYNSQPIPTPTTSSSPTPTPAQTSGTAGYTTPQGVPPVPSSTPASTPPSNHSPSPTPSPSNSPVFTPSTSPSTSPVSYRIDSNKTASIFDAFKTFFEVIFSR